MIDAQHITCRSSSISCAEKVNFPPKQSQEQKEEEDTPEVKLNFHIGATQAAADVAAAATVAAGPRTGDAQCASIAADDDDRQHEHGVTEEFYR